MLVPDTVLALLNHALLNMKRNGHISSEERIAIFRSFGDSSRIPGTKFTSYVKANRKPPFTLSIADQALSWLAILTARKTEPMWLQAGFDPQETKIIRRPYYSFNPFLIISLAEDVMYKSIPVLVAANDLFNAINAGMAALTNSDPPLLKSYGFYSAYHALASVLFGSEAHMNNCVSFSAETYSLEEKAANHRELVLYYEKMNSPAVQKEWDDFLSLYGSVDMIPFDVETPFGVADVPVPIPVFDPQKRREFWQWWLTEAIPQAWAMVD